MVVKQIEDTVVNLKSMFRVAVPSFLLHLMTFSPVSVWRCFVQSGSLRFVSTTGLCVSYGKAEPWDQTPLSRDFWVVSYWQCPHGNWCYLLINPLNYSQESKHECWLVLPSSMQVLGWLGQSWPCHVWWDHAIEVLSLNMRRNCSSVLLLGCFLYFYAL